MVQTNLEQIYQEHRLSLTALSYRLTGSWSEAEDIVQELFLDFHRNGDADGIRQLKSYFMKAVVNRSLNVLKSPRYSREQYVGPWLPEPVFDAVGEPNLDFLLEEEHLSYAFMVMLERLSADERAVFVLRESFALEYPEIADILGKSEAACRKLLSRARQKVKADLPASPLNNAVVSRWVSVFTKAAQTGEFGPLLELIREDAVLVSDGGGKARAALRPIETKARIAAFWEGITRKGSLRGELVPVRMNGEIGLILYDGGAAVKVLLFEVDSLGRIARFYLLVNPDKLKNAPVW